MNLRKRAFLSVLILSSIIFCQLASAVVGVSPSSYFRNFEPNHQEVFHFEFDGNEDTVFDIYVQGDLAEYVQLSTTKINYRGGVNVLLQLPSEIEVPGDHILYVGARQSGPTKGGFAIVGNIKGIITIRVPYPQKYAVVSLVAPDTKAGDSVDFKVKVSNLGKEAIDAETNIEMYDSNKQITQTFYLGKHNIPTKESKDIPYSYNTSVQDAGKYSAKAIVFYDVGKVGVAEASFRLGELYVNISSNTNDLLRKVINKFDVEVESFWNDPIDNVYAEVGIINHSVVFKTPSVRLDGFGKTTLTGFFDTSDIEEDEFKANITIFYEDKISHKIVDLNFKREVNWLLYSLIAAVVIALVILAIILYIINRLKKTRKINTKNGRK